MRSSVVNDPKQRLDKEAIEALRYRYACLCDQDYVPDAIADLFVQEATWDGDQFGVQEGHDAGLSHMEP